MWVWALSFGLLVAGSTLMAPPDGDVARSDSPRQGAVTDPRVHAESSFRLEVERLIQREPLDDMATGARAFHNDIEITVNRATSVAFAATTCDEQRDFAATIWQVWSEFGDVPRAGAGVTIKSYTGRTLASAEQGLTGAQFHYD